MPRALALDLLNAVLHDRLSLELALERALAAKPSADDLAPRDLALARNLAATALRRLGQIDALIGHFLSSPLPPRAKMAHQIMRLGVCQLLFMRIPAHAAVDASVSLAARRAKAYKNLVNAILRRVANEGLQLAADQDAARLNTPDWLWESWRNAYGDQICRAIAEADLKEAPLDLTLKSDAVEYWKQKLNASLLPTGGLRLGKSGSVALLPGYADGAWWVQDIAASLPVRLLGDVKGQRIIEIGAAPGGKTAQLACAGALVTAVEKSKSRMARMSENMERLGLPVEKVTADALEWRPRRPAGAVLLDVPCSATGTIRRHPDVLRLKTPADVAKLAAMQKKLLLAASEMVKPGGLLVYAACSLQPEEGPGAIEWLLTKKADFKRAAVEQDELCGMGGLISQDGDLRALPCHLLDQGGMDGFFAARMRRI